jgi:protein CpxP
MHHHARKALIAGAALSLLTATTGFAQTGGPQGHPPGAEAPGKWMKRHHDPAAHAQHLRDALQLRADQEPALQAFLATMKPPEGARGKMRGERGEMAKLTTPERLDRQAARMAERQAAFARKADATKRFYGALSPTQQKAFDAMHPGKGGKMGRRGGGMRGHGW